MGPPGDPRQLVPETDDEHDIGTADLRWKDVWSSGTVTCAKVSTTSGLIGSTGKTTTISTDNGDVEGMILRNQGFGGMAVYFRGPLMFEGSGTPFPDIGQANGPTWRDLHLSGVGHGKDFVALSDRSLKDNITKIDSAKCLDQVMNLSPREFVWKDTGNKDTGLIAQEVREVLPEHVHGADVLAVSYGKIVTQLIGAVHALNERVQQLEKEQ